MKQKNQNKKGFTLIELLSIIVILGVIAVITVPVVTNIMSTVKKNSFKNSANGLVESAKVYFSSKTDAVDFSGKTFTFGENSNIEGLNFKGKQPKAGEVIVNTDGEIKMYVTDGEYCAFKDFSSNEVLITEGESCVSQPETPIINVAARKVTTDSVYLTAMCSYESGADIKISKYEFSKDGGKNWDSKLLDGDYANYYIYGGLKQDNEYKFMARCITDIGVFAEKSIDVQLNEIGNIIINVPDGWAKEKEVTIKYPKGRYQYQYQELQSSNDLVVDNNWITVTETTSEGDYNQFSKTYTSNKYIIARVIDDSGNFVMSSGLGIQKIDTTPPVCGVWTENTEWTHKDVTITLSCNEKEDASNNISGCEQDVYNVKTFKETTTSPVSLKYTIKDKAQNETECSNDSVDVYLDKSEPKLEIGTITTLTSSATINIKTNEDSDSKISKTVCKLGLKDGEYTIEGTVNSDKTRCVASGLNNNTQYYYIVTTTNTAGLSTSKKGSIKTEDFGVCEVKISNPSDWTTSKTATITGNTKTGTTLQYSVYTSIDGVDTGWKNYSSTITLNKIATMDKPTSVRCRYIDDKNIQSASTFTTTRIDPTAPELTLDGITTTTKSITIPFEAKDLESGINETTCVYGTSTSYGNEGTISGNKCIINDETSGTTYYYKITTTNKAKTPTTVTGNTKTVETGTCSVEIANEAVWKSSKVATIKGNITTGESLQYRIVSGNTEKVTWTTVNSGKTHTINWAANTTTPTSVYCRVTDGKNTKDGLTKTQTKVDVTAPEVTVKSLTKETEKLVITYEEKDSESGIKGTICEYGTSTSYGKSVTGSSGKCTITGLTANTKYYFKVTTTNNAELKASSTGDTSTGVTNIDFSETQIPANTPYAQSKTITVKYSSTNVTTPTYYFKTTVATETNISVYSCGSEASPGTCSSSKTTITKTTPGVWYKTESNPSIKFTSNGSLYARINDGSKYSSAELYTVSTIDTTAPSAAVAVGTIKTDRVTLTATCSDAESGLATKAYEYSNDGGTTWTNATSSATYTYTGLTQSKQYTFKVRCTNGSGLTKVGEKLGTTAGITAPTIDYNKADWATSKALKITYSAANVNSPAYFVRSTVTGTSNVALITCGSTSPKAAGDCVGTEIAAGKALTAGTWYKVKSGTTATITIKANGSINAQTGDGTNIKAATTATVTKIDTTAPSAAVAVGTIKTDRVTLTATCSDAESGLATKAYEYSNDGGTTWTNATSSATYTYTGLTQSKQYTFKVRCTNGSGLTKVGEKLGTTAGITAPTIDYNKADWATSKALKITYSAANVNSPAYFVRSTVTGTSNVALITCGSTSPKAAGDCVGTEIAAGKALTAGTWYKVKSGTTATITIKVNGTITAQTADGTNIKTAESATVTKIDTTKPTCTWSGESTTWRQSGTVKVSCTDTGGSECDTTATSKSWAYTSGTATTTTAALSYVIKDNAGNSTTCSKTANVYVDRTGPTCTWSGESTTWRTSGTITVTCNKGTGSNCDTTATTKSWAYTSGTSTTKTAALSYVIKDAVGNSTTCSKTANVYVDRTAPTCKWSGESTTWRLSGTITATCLDTNGSGCTSATTSKSWPYTTVTTATKTAALSYDMADAVGNKAPCSKTANVYVDPTAPSANLALSSLKTDRITLTAACSDGESGLATNAYEYSKDNGTTWTSATSNATYTYTGLTQGTTYNFKVRCKNKLGKSTTAAKSGKPASIPAPTFDAWSTSWSQSKTLKANYTSTNVQTPTYLIKSTVSGTTNVALTPCTVSNNIPTCSGTAVAAGGTITANTWYKINSGATVSITLKANGSLTAATSDNKNKFATAVATITTIDTTKPTCTFSGESTSWRTSGTITATCKDETGGSGCTSATASKSWAYTSGTATTKTAALSYTITDNAGNSTTCSKTANVYVDRTAPTCTWSGESTSWRTSGTVKATCADTGSGCTSATASKSWAYTSGTATTKKAALSYSMADALGNKATCSKTANVYVDRTAPTCTWSGESTTWRTSGTVKATCADSGSGCTSATASKSWAYTSGTATTKTAALSYSMADGVGNTATCSKTANVYVDRTAPSFVSWSGTSTTWTNNNRLIGINYSDSGVGPSAGYADVVTVSTNTNTKAVSKQVCDKLNNCATYSATVNAKVAKSFSVSYKVEYVNEALTAINGSTSASNGAFAGPGNSQALNSITITKNDSYIGGDIQISVHAQNDGWKSYVGSGTETSAPGTKRLEGVKIKLTGDLATVFDVYYKGHARSIGDLGWARNDEVSGSQALCLRLEKIAIKLVPKNATVSDYGSASPSVTSSSYNKCDTTASCNNTCTKSVPYTGTCYSYSYKGGNCGANCTGTQVASSNCGGASCCCQYTSSYSCTKYTTETYKCC